jgi:Tfp pilus assembly protein PilF
MSIVNPAGPPRRSWLVHREVVLLTVLAAVTAGAFAITRGVAAASRARQSADAASWFARGQTALREGQTAAAIGALRRAVAMDRGDRDYQLALAVALVRVGERHEARERLRALRDRAPDDAAASLELARLAAGDGDLSTAVRHYSDTLSAIWPAEQSDARRQVRLELIDLLLAHAQQSRALSELLVLAATLPDDPALHVAAGRRFLLAGDARLAAEHFARALARLPDSPQALAGAGEAALARGDYAAARRFLGALPDRDARLTDLWSVANLVLTTDPLAPRLSRDERRRRSAAAVSRAFTRLEACLAARGVSADAATDALRSDGDRARALLGSRAGLTRDEIDAAFEVAVRLERAANGCPGGEPLDRAIVRIAERHGVVEP